jgi:fermentation-respiration switch protein FrsA (DUF1100 family)
MARQRISPLRLLKSLAVSILLAAIIVVMFRRMLEDRMLYYPEREISETPAAVGLDFSDVELATDDGVRLHAWHVRAMAGRAPRGLVIHFHGNAGNVSHRLPWAVVFAGEGLETLLVDYRGYGRSGGKPSEEGLYRDADAAWRWAQDRGGIPVIAYGESLGGAVAIDLASRRQVAGLVAQSTFTNLGEMAARVFPFGGALVTQRFGSIDKIGRLAVPLLVIHGERDELVPFAMGEQLHRAALPPKSFLAVPRAGHNDVIDLAGPEIARRTAALLGAVP